MGDAKTPRVVAPLVGLLSNDSALLTAAQAPLQELFGPIEFESPLYPFNPTDYYTETMGPDLQRQFLSFKNMADPAALSDWKLACNALEEKLARQFAKPGAPQRPINIDPGYINGAKLVLASTKDFAHRIYLRDGIYAEITLAFRGDGWESHRFTFPDFKSGVYDAFLKKVRDKYLQKIKYV